MTDTPTDGPDLDALEYDCETATHPSSADWARAEAAARILDASPKLIATIRARDTEISELQDAVTNLQVNYNEASAALTLSQVRVAALEAKLQTIRTVKPMRKASGHYDHRRLVDFMRGVASSAFYVPQGQPTE